MRHKRIIAFSATALILSLAGCSSESAETSPTSTTTSPAATSRTHPTSDPHQEEQPIEETPPEEEPLPEEIVIERPPVAREATQDIETDAGVDPDMLEFFPYAPFGRDADGIPEIPAGTSASERCHILAGTPCPPGEEAPFESFA